MPRGMHKSNTFRKVFVKTPGNRTTVHYRTRKPSKAVCGKCGAVLPGVASEKPYKLKKMSKTEKRPERPYGGNLCSKCLRLTMKARATSFKVI